VFTSNLQPNGTLRAVFDKYVLKHDEATMVHQASRAGTDWNRLQPLVHRTAGSVSRFQIPSYALVAQLDPIINEIAFERDVLTSSFAANLSHQGTAIRRKYDLSRRPKWQPSAISQRSNGCGRKAMRNDHPDETIARMPAVLQTS
jgi:hypothetical protein